ncbi:MAG: hypothetical protein U0637_06460 [Phycisphaerales bacterium]
MRTVGVIGASLLVTTCMGQVFVGLGVVPGANASTANAISSDGSTVVGTSQQFGGAAWRWTLSTGRVDLGALPGGFLMEHANDVSGDGSVIVGGMNDGVSVSTAWRWTLGTGIQRVTGIGAGAFGPYVSSNGSTIVGRAEGTPLSAVRWTQATGVQSLNPVTGLPFGNGSTTIAYGVSGDGSVVVGVGLGTSSNTPPTLSSVPFRWTQLTGSVGVLNNGQFFGAPAGVGATDVSDDGAVMVGIGEAGVFRWNAVDGFQLLFNEAQPPGSGRPHVSGDGLTAVYGQRIWTQMGGLLSLNGVLTSAGCNFSGWSNLIATGVDCDGNTFCGFGTNPAGQTEAWYATIPAPGVGTFALAALSVSALRRRR